MGTAQIGLLVVGLIITALLSGIAYLLKGRLDGVEKRIAAIAETQVAHGLALASLTASQIAMTDNQKTISAIHVKLFDHIEELDDVTEQLQFATKTLQDRGNRYDEFMKARAKLSDSDKD